MNGKDLVRLKSNLPKVPGILDKNKYFNSAVLIPLIFIKNEYYFLFEKRSAHIRQGSEISFPGGEFDESIDSSYLDTAVREAIEETGVKKSEIEILGQLDTFIGPMGVTVDPFIAVLNIDDPDKLNFDKNEVEKIFTVPVSYFINNQPEQYYVRMQFNPEDVDENGKTFISFPAEKLGIPSRYSKIWRGRKHELFVYKVSGETIWGITSQLIREVIRKLSA